MFKKVLNHIGVGLAVGSVVSCACLALMAGVDGTLAQVLAWLGASALYGLISLIYDAEAIPLPLAIGLHVLLCLAVTLGTGLLLGYHTLFGSQFWLMIPMFAVIYVGISVGIWLYGRHCAKTTTDRLARK